jgi:hypothetical protein
MTETKTRKVVRKAPAPNGAVNRRAEAKAEAALILIQYQDAKAKIAELNEQAASYSAQIQMLMEQARIKNLSAKKGTKTISATIVAGSKLVIDELGLKKAVGAAMWNKLTSRILDRKKLDAFIASGEVSADTVAKCSEEHPIAPYLRLTTK